jgi:diadenosine tetraphosphate (Ap4A) HIT family hydrolase
MINCPLCTLVEKKILVKSRLYSIVLLEDKNYPGYLQLITNSHVKEMSDLVLEDAMLIYSTLFKLEKVLRKIFTPDKINIASFGNIVPHLHWHIIPRFLPDLHFPNSIWGEIQNPNYIPPQELINLEKNLISYFKNVFKEEKV